MNDANNSNNNINSNSNNNDDAAATFGDISTADFRNNASTLLNIPVMSEAAVLSAASKHHHHHQQQQQQQQCRKRRLYGHLRPSHHGFGYTRLGSHHGTSQMESPAAMSHGIRSPYHR
mmetsp:Transcript_2227/g.3078  ORF Transcript_2227/g.3078 Transcript_2227/m.3078 type:complete len:118 (+) Transcript_2227:146-499(+)